MRVAPPVDVAGRNLGGDNVGLGQWQWCAVVCGTFETRERSRLGCVEDHHLTPTGRGVLRVRWRLPVEPDVARGLFDQAVGLAGNHEGVVGQADVKRLAAASKRQVQSLGGCQGGR